MIFLSWAMIILELISNQAKDKREYVGAQLVQGVNNPLRTCLQCLVMCQRSFQISKRKFPNSAVCLFRDLSEHSKAIQD